MGRGEDPIPCPKEGEAAAMCKRKHKGKGKHPNKRASKGGRGVVREGCKNWGRIQSGGRGAGEGGREERATNPRQQRWQAC